MIRQYLVGAVFLGLAACATPGSEMPGSSVVAASDVEDKDTIVCKIERPSGTLLRKKVCLPASEWKRIEDNAQDFIYENRMKAAGQH
jgi:hypothetical protein